MRLKISGSTLTVTIATRIIIVLMDSLMIPRFRPMAEAAMMRESRAESRKPAESVSRQVNWSLNRSAGSSLTRKAASTRNGSSSSAAGDPASTLRLKLAPTMMKKMGMKKPKPTASSWCIASMSSRVEMSESMAPAMKAPRMISAPNVSARTTKSSMMVNAPRILMRAVAWLRSSSRRRTACTRSMIPRR